MWEEYIPPTSKQIPAGQAPLYMRIDEKYKYTTISIADRKLIKISDWNKTISFHKEHKIGCFHEVWESKSLPSQTVNEDVFFDNLDKRIRKENMENRCFFMRKEGDIGLEAAEKLQKRRWELAESSKDRKLIKKWIIITWVLIGLTFLALIVDTLFRLCEK
jgi:hypothetical protein